MPMGKSYKNKKEAKKLPVAKDPLHRKPMNHGAPSAMSAEGGLPMPGKGKARKARVNAGMDVNSK